MKAFLRRLKFYGIGFGIGLVFVFFFFQNRGCSWLPGNRVKNTILGRVIVLSDSQESLLAANGLKADDALAFLNDGDIRFGKSKKAGNPQVYSIVKEVGGREVELWFTLPKDAFVSEVLWPVGSIQQAGNSKNGVGKMISFPHVRSFVFLDNNQLFNCQKRELGLQSAKLVQYRLMTTGKIDFAHSKLDGAERPVQHILFSTAGGTEIGANTTWKEEHIQFTHFESSRRLSCPGN
jgi:hypothetical protein